nr:alpha/beta hydrolase [Sphingomonas bacterium]
MLVVGLGAAAYLFVDPPRLLSWADAVAGGGRGVEQAADGVPFGTHGQRLDVWRPAGPVTRRPVLVFFHGGGWVHGSRGAYAFAGRAFARAGFVVVVPDYRKVPAVRYPAFLQDNAQAMRWVQDHVAAYGGDPGRVAIAGHSAGGYTVAMLALDPRWLRAAGVAPGFVKAGVGLCGPYDFFPFRKERAIDAFRGVADGPDTQPINHAGAAAPPLLLISAGADTQVGAHNAVNLTARLRAVGAPVIHLDHPGLSHESIVMALSVPFRGRAPVLAESVAFLRRALKEAGAGSRP